MNWSEDIAALNDCIKNRWEQLALGEEPKHDTCALCELNASRNRKYVSTYCNSCIIRLDTERSFCNGTNYYEWQDFEGTPEAIEPANEMLTYLKDLRRRIKSEQ